MATKNETRDSDCSNEIENQSKQQVIIKIPKDLKHLISEPGLWPSQLCIYKVPRKLRAINPTAYTPQMISIGPFHHNDEALKVMEKQKLRYLAGFCERIGKHWTELSPKVQDWEEAVRHCYEEEFEVSSQQFTEMILLDSVFIIELFLRRGEKYNFINGKTQETYRDDYILGKSTREFGLLEDLILVENQIPYFILEDLYDFTIGKTEYPCFSDLMRLNLKHYLSPPQIEEKENKNCCCDCFSCLYCFWISRFFSWQRLKDQSVKEGEEEEEENYLAEKPLHFTDLVRKYRSYKHPKSNNNNGSVTKLYRATMLNEAGVKFKVSSQAWPINLKFKRGELKMPTFLADYNTERLIRNLMAFEQCHYPNQPLICDYIWILDFLINNEKDVDLLVKKGIIVNLLGNSESVATLVNNLGLQIMASGSCFYDLSLQLNKHYDNVWCRTVAIMRRVYFNNLWRGTGTIAAIVLLFFTFTQSVYSIINIFHV